MKRDVPVRLLRIGRSKAALQTELLEDRILNLVNPRVRAG
jgi:hypothetical protein